MNWTFEKPTVPGIYVYNTAPDHYFPDGCAYVAKVYSVDGCLRVKGKPVQSWNQDGPFFGPIPEPPKRGETNADPS